ncbi:MAG: nucleotidyltransferase family protein [Solirubrobacteraceae bacterium]
MRPALSMWDHLEEVVGDASSTQALRAHGVHLFAAQRWRAAGREVPADLQEDERRATMLGLAAPLLLQHVRSACTGRIMLMKGAEVAACYLDPATRYFRDLDIVVDDPRAVQRALIACGFVEGGRPEAFEDIHHLRPLVWPGIPLIVEVHHKPKCPAWLAPPSVEELMGLSVASRTGVEGVLAPSPAAHALLLAAHSWAHQPLGRLRDLVDIVAVLGHSDRRLAAELAHRWRWERMWTTTLAAADAILAGAPRPRWLSVWGRHLQPLRERTVLEDHLQRVVAPLYALPPAGAVRALGAALGEFAARYPGESRVEKLRRSRRAVAHAFMDQSAHDLSVQALSKEGT